MKRYKIDNVILDRDGLEEYLIYNAYVDDIYDWLDYNYKAGELLIKIEDETLETIYKTYLKYMRDEIVDLIDRKKIEVIEDEDE